MYFESLMMIVVAEKTDELEIVDDDGLKLDVPQIKGYLNYIV